MVEFPLYGTLVPGRNTSVVTVHVPPHTHFQHTERATDNAASAGNLALHLEICDQINDTDNG